MGYTTGAIKEYDAAFSVLYSLQSYLMQRKAIFTQNGTLRNEGINLMNSARVLDNLNGYFEASIVTPEETDKETKKLALEWLLGNEAYHDICKDLEKAPMKKIDSCLEDLDDLRKLFLHGEQELLLLLLLQAQPTWFQN